jgi:hypothetical protein
MANGEWMEAGNYIVIDLRNGNYALGAKSAQPGVDFAMHLGGMRMDSARKLADKLNAEGHEPEVEPQGRDSAGRFIEKRQRTGAVHNLAERLHD